MSDTTKASLYSSYRAFKNNNVYTGSATITGSTSVGANIRTFNVALGEQPDMVDIVFNGATAFNGGTDPRPANGWFKQGQVWVRGDNAGAGLNNFPTNWQLYARINGSSLTITAQYTQTFTSALTLTDTVFSYRLVDYSVF